MKRPMLHKIFQAICLWMFLMCCKIDSGAPYMKYLRKHDNGKTEIRYTKLSGELFWASKLLRMWMGRKWIRIFRKIPTKWLKRKTYLIGVYMACGKPITKNDPLWKESE